MRKQLLDHGYVELVESWGSDEKIVEAARMSTKKGFQGWGTPENPGDEKLLKFLMKNGHSSPFEMAGASFEIKLPIFVCREWHRHRTQSYNEMSGRYTELPNERYVPSFARLQRSKRKISGNLQGSSEGLTTEQAADIRHDIREAYDNNRAVYEEMLRSGVAPEICRLVLPVSQYTKMRAQAVLSNWFKFLKLRLAPTAQEEIRVYAEAVAEELKMLFPVSYALFEEFGK